MLTGPQPSWHTFWEPTSECPPVQSNQLTPTPACEKILAASRSAPLSMSSGASAMLYTSIVMVGLGSASVAKSGLGHVITASNLRKTRDLRDSLKYCRAQFFLILPPRTPGPNLTRRSPAGVGGVGRRLAFGFGSSITGKLVRRMD